MNKVTIKEFRAVKDFTLPESGVTLSCYSSVLVGDMDGFMKDGDQFDKNLDIILKCIKEWNLYEKDTDEKPLPISHDNFKKLPAHDLEWLIKELETFSLEQKKN